MLKETLIISLFILNSCDDSFKQDFNSFQGGSAEKTEPEKSEDAIPATFDTGSEKRVVRTSGLFGDGAEVNVDLPAAAIKAVKADGSENLDEINVANAEEFKILWESKFVNDCTVTATESNGTVVESINWTGIEGEETVSKLFSDTTFTLNCESDTETLTDSVLVKIEGGWLPVGRNLSSTQKICSNFCADRGMTNIRSRDGSFCASGESLPESALGFLTQHYGCWGGGCDQKHGYSRTISVGHRCYGEGQKRDNDSTDTTVGCYCVKTTL